MTTSSPSTSTHSALVDELAAVLRGADLFESVTVGEDAGSLHRFPACVIVPRGSQAERVSPGAQVRSYGAMLLLAARSADTMEDVKRLLDLRAASRGLLEGAVFTNVSGHFDTAVSSAPANRADRTASMVKTTALAVEMFTMEAI